MLTFYTCQNDVRMTSMHRSNDMMSHRHYSDVMCLLEVKKYNLPKKSKVKSENYAYIFSSPERKDHGELIVYPMVRPSVPPSKLSNIFFSETTGSIEVKFPVEDPWIAGTKVCKNVATGHRIKVEN